MAPAAAPPEFVEVRCAGCGETLEVEPALTEFACPDCGTQQALPPELMPPPPPRPRRALPIPGRGSAAAAPVPVPVPVLAPARMPCGACAALLSVPAGLLRFACPLCGVELTVDGGRLRVDYASPPRVSVSVLAPPPAGITLTPSPHQGPEGQVEKFNHPTRSIQREETLSYSKTGAICTMSAQKEPSIHSALREESRIEPLNKTIAKSSVRKTKLPPLSESTGVQKVRQEPPIHVTSASQAQVFPSSYSVRSQGQQPVEDIVSHGQRINEYRAVSSTIRHETVEAPNQVNCVEQAQSEYQSKATGWNLKRKRSGKSATVQKGKKKGLTSYPNGGVHLRRSTRLSKQPENPINDEPVQQPAASNQCNSDPVNIGKIISDLCPSPFPQHQMPQASSCLSSKGQADAATGSSPSNHDAPRDEQCPLYHSHSYPPKVLGKHSLDRIGDDEGSDDEFVLCARLKRTQPQKVPAHAQGSGHTSQQGQSSAPGHGRKSKHASQGDEGARYDHNIDLSPFEHISVPISRPTRARNDPPLLDFNLSINDMKPLRYQDPRELDRSFHGDPRFWLAHQADWYESVILTKKTITTEMKWINWDYLRTLSSPCKEVIDAVHYRCRHMGLINIMHFSSEWNEEVVAQFYATLYVDDRRNVMHFTLWGKRFSIKMSEFAALFGLGGVVENQYGVCELDRRLIRLHEGKELDVRKMHFMYDKAYGNVVFGHTNGLTPYYKLLNQLFRFTLTPRGGDSENISRRAKNLLYQMAPSEGKFNVCDFLWREIITCSYDASSRCHYAPYIFHMIKHVTNLNIRADKSHGAYKSSKGKIEQLLKIGSHGSGETSKGPFPRIYPIQGLVDAGASSSQAPRYSYGPLPTHGATHTYGVPKNKKGKLGFIAQGLFSYFNMCRQNAREYEETRKLMAEVFHKCEKWQKEIYAKLNMPHSPVREPRVFPPLSPIANPWEDLGSYVPVDEIEEEDRDGCERRQDDDDETEEEGSFHEDDGEDEEDDGEDEEAIEDDNDD